MLYPFPSTILMVRDRVRLKKHRNQWIFFSAHGHERAPPFAHSHREPSLVCSSLTPTHEQRLAQTLQTIMDPDRIHAYLQVACAALGFDIGEVWWTTSENGSSTVAAIGR